MPTNEQRRAAAKRKLERQLARRAEKARRRKQLTIAGTALGVVVLVAAAAGVYFWTRDDGSPEAAEGTVNCEYTPSQEPAAKPVDKPRTEGIRTGGENSELSISISTGQGPMGLTLDNNRAPCTVNSFASLASQGYFDGTECHRLTQSEGLKVLQCGDPSASGMGGPGYQFANEYPTTQFPAGDPAAQQPMTYERGMVAMANAGPGTNGSQFFLVYGDSQLPPNYTIFGRIDETGLQTLDKIAAAGQDDSNGPGDGKPREPVKLESVTID